MKLIGEREEEIQRTVEMVDACLSSQKDILVMTSRQLITGKGGPSTLFFSHL